MVSASELLAEIERDLPFFTESGGGVTFSGGEPLMQPVFLREMLSLCAGRGISTVVDTSGYASRDSFTGVIDACDLFLFDLKHVDPVKHLEFTGVDNGLILSNLSSLISSGCSVIVRVPVVKGFNDDTRSAGEICSFLAGLPGRVSVEVVKCHGYASEKYRDLGLSMGDFVPSEESMAAFRGMLLSAGLLEGNCD